MNTPITKTQVQDMDKGFYPNLSPNRKKRREPLQKDRANQNHVRLLVYGKNKVWQYKQAIKTQSGDYKIITHFSSKRPF